MYSCEIDSLMKASGYDLPSKTYLEVCHSSPQICRVRYTSYENFFEIWTHDNCYWKFLVHADKV